MLFCPSIFSFKTTGLLSSCHKFMDPFLIRIHLFVAMVQRTKLINSKPICESLEWLRSHCLTCDCSSFPFLRDRKLEEKERKKRNRQMTNKVRFQGQWRTSTSVKASLNRCSYWLDYDWIEDLDCFILIQLTDNDDNTIRKSEISVSERKYALFTFLELYSSLSYSFMKLTMFVLSFRVGGLMMFPKTLLPK